eukprot:GHVH01003703.1.p1 GENE.GHVH01003703.1~~GHVH01003703.1.p1  ORF type:complete len:303 (+),score=64.35 GHVH01003703.1:25-909(+)
MSAMITVDKVEYPIIEEVSICSGLTKKIIKHGEGEEPSSGFMCDMHYTGTLAKDDTKFDSSRDRNESFSFQVGVGQVIKGWDQGVITMKKGEQAVLCIESALGYGEAGAGPIPANADLNFHVELLDFHEKSKEMWEMSEEEKMNFAEDKKRSGNLALKENDLMVACACYDEALKAFDSIEVEELAPAYKDLKKALLSNQAIAMLKSGNFIQARMSAASVLDMDPKNVKARYNIVQANDKLGEFEVALQDLKKALEDEDLTEDQISMFTRLRGVVKTHATFQDQKEKKVYGRMFA